MKISKSLFTTFWYVVTFLNIGLLFLIESMVPSMDPTGFKLVRYALMAFLCLISFKRRKLSLWIFSSMIIGVEVGMDFPAFALEMERFGKIFLRLIKSLVAPLIFGTLVVGIAGHSNLKQVGRIGLKSILYLFIFLCNIFLVNL